MGKVFIKTKRSDQFQFLINIKVKKLIKAVQEVLEVVKEIAIPGEDCQN